MSKTASATNSRSHATLFLSAGRIISSLLALVTVVVLSRLLSQQTYGIYQQVWLVFNTAAPMLILGLPSSVTYYLPQRNEGEQKTLMGQTVLMLASAGFLMSVGTLIFSKPLAAQLGGKELETLLRLFFIYPILSLPLKVMDTYFTSTGQAVSAAWFNVYSSTLDFAAVVLPILLGYDLKTAILLLNVSAFGRFCYAVIYLYQKYKSVPFKWDVPFMGQQLKYAIPLGLSGIVGTLNYQLDCIMVATLFTASNYAVYVNGAKELPFVGVVMGSVMAVITPDFVRLFTQGRHNELLNLWHSATQKIAYLFFPMTCFLMTFAADFIVVLFSSRYLASVPIFRIYLLLLPIRITVYGSLLMASGHTRLILQSAIMSLVLNLLIIYPLSQSLGLVGASISTILSTFFLVGWQLRKVCHILETPWRKIFPWNKLASVMFLSIPPAAVASLATHALPNGIVRLGAGFFIYVLVAGPTLWFAGGGQKEFKPLLRSRLSVQAETST
jgi:O-antigen/teichoic acid export membrane protein